MRITLLHIESAIDRLNAITTSPMTPWTKTNGKLTANIDNYHLSMAYGGHELHRMMNTGGGIYTPLSTGYTTKRDLFNHINTFISGVSTN